MIVFPAIDLIGGRVVRLERGDRAHMKVYSDDPVAVAEDFRDRGAQWVHVVDLSAALEEDAAAQAANAVAIQGICAVPGIQIDAGGGVRSLAAFERLLALGARRVAVGTALVRDAAFAAQLARSFGDHAVADVAARGGRVRVNGWREAGELSADELVSRLADWGFKHLVFTDVARDGMQTGIDADAYAHIAEIAGFPIVASGGIASISDIEALASLGSQIIEGAICGRALLEGSLLLEDVLAAAERKG